MLDWASPWSIRSPAQGETRGIPKGFGAQVEGKGGEREGKGGKGWTRRGTRRIHERGPTQEGDAAATPILLRRRKLLIS
jgi:hypothetical protein